MVKLKREGFAVSLRYERRRPIQNLFRTGRCVCICGAGVKACPVCCFLLVLAVKQKTRLNKLTQAETMTRLIRACPWATYDTSIAGANLEAAFETGTTNERL